MSFFGQRAAILDTNVARPLAIRLAAALKYAMKQHLWAVSRTPAASPRVRLQSALMDFGATLHGAPVPDLSMQRGCKAYPFNPENGTLRPAQGRPLDQAQGGRMTPSSRGHRRGSRPLFRDETAERRPPRRPVGVSRRQVRGRRITRGVPAARTSGGTRHGGSDWRRSLHGDPPLPGSQR